MLNHNDDESLSDMIFIAKYKICLRDKLTGEIDKNFT